MSSLPFKMFKCVCCPSNYQHVLWSQEEVHVSLVELLTYLQTSEHVYIIISIDYLGKWCALEISNQSGSAMAMQSY